LETGVIKDSWNVLLSWTILVGLSFLVLIVFWLLMNKFTPSLLNILSGGRRNKQRAANNG